MRYKHLVYALVDPRQPEVLVYIGRTTAGATKRLSDHCSEARLKAKRGHLGSPKNQWVTQLLELDLVPGIVPLADGLTREQGIACEQEWIRNLTGHGILNSPKYGNCVSGKMEGSTDPVSGRQNKSKAWQENYEHRCQVARDTAGGARAGAKRHAQHTERRRALGFPYPELMACHHKNWAHRDKLRAEGKLYTFISPSTIDAMVDAARAQHQVRRAAKGYPHPEHRVHHPLNIEYHRSVLRARYRDRRLVDA